MPAAKYLDAEGLAYLWGKIKTYVGDSVESGNADLTNKIHFVVPDQKNATASLTATVDGISALVPGVVIALWMPFDNRANTTLNINNLGAVPLHYKNGSASAGMFPSGAVIALIYEDESVAAGCFKAVYSYNADTHYTTSLYASGSSTAIDNSTNDTSNDSTYLVVNDATSSSVVVSKGSIRITGAGSTTVSARNGTLTINSEVPPEYAPVESSTIDTLFNGQEAYVDKTFTIKSQSWSYGLFNINILAQENGSVTGINTISQWWAGDSTIVIESNTDYVFRDDPIDYDLFSRQNLNGISARIYGKNEDGASVDYNTIGSGITGYSASDQATWNGVYVWAEAENESPDDCFYWNTIPFDPEDLEGDGIVFYINMANDDNEHAGGHLVSPTSSDGIFKVTLFKDFDENIEEDRVYVKLRWICTE